MKQVKIFPIFNQNTNGVWDKFTGIRSAALAGNGINLKDKDITDCKYVFENNWQTKTGNFAFAAYCGKSMVGQINGYLIDDAIFVENLYVLPKHQNLGVGTRLLNATEKYASVSRKFLYLFSSFETENFCEKNNYYLNNETYVYEKNIQDKGHCDTVPLFYCTANLARTCSKLSNNEYKLKPEIVNKLHKPVFIYRDVNNVISGYGIIDTTDNQSQQIIFGNTEWVKWRLKNTIDNYLLQQKLLYPNNR